MKTTIKDLLIQAEDLGIYVDSSAPLYEIEQEVEEALRRESKYYRQARSDYYASRL